MAASPTRAHVPDPHRPPPSQARKQAERRRGSQAPPPRRRVPRRDATWAARRRGWQRWGTPPLSASGAGGPAPAGRQGAVATRTRSLGGATRPAAGPRPQSDVSGGSRAPPSSPRTVGLKRVRPTHTRGGRRPAGQQAQWRRARGGERRRPTPDAPAADTIRRPPGAVRGGVVGRHPRVATGPIRPSTAPLRPPSRRAGAPKVADGEVGLQPRLTDRGSLEPPIALVRGMGRSIRVSVAWPPFSRWRRRPVEVPQTRWRVRIRVSPQTSKDAVVCPSKTYIARVWTRCVLAAAKVNAIQQSDCASPRDLQSVLRGPPPTLRSLSAGCVSHPLRRGGPAWRLRRRNVSPSTGRVDKSQDSVTHVIGVWGGER